MSFPAFSAHGTVLTLSSSPPILFLKFFWTPCWNPTPLHMQGLHLGLSCPLRRAPWKEPQQSPPENTTGREQGIFPCLQTLPNSSDGTIWFLNAWVRPALCLSFLTIPQDKAQIHNMEPPTSPSAPLSSLNTATPALLLSLSLNNSYLLSFWPGSPLPQHPAPCTWFTVSHSLGSPSDRATCTPRLPAVHLFLFLSTGLHGAAPPQGTAPVPVSSLDSTAQ